MGRIKLSGAMDNPDVRRYAEILRKKRVQLFFKRFFDLLTSVVLLLILWPIMVIVALLVKLDSRGPVFFRQVRVTTGSKQFRIFKFRTMVNGAEKIGSAVTEPGDTRITRLGKIMRVTRLDELPQLLNVLCGQMSFVGTRPEVPKYVDRYTDEMRATLLMPAGITSNASIRFRNEQELLEGEENIDDAYVNNVLPRKMKYNLEYLENYSLWLDFSIMLKTVASVFGHNYYDENPPE